MKRGYARVSTDEQHLDLQADALTATGCPVIYRDDGISGTSTGRQGLAQALTALGGVIPSLSGNWIGSGVLWAFCAN